MFVLDLGDPRIHKKEAEPLGRWALRIHFVQHVPENYVGAKEADAAGESKNYLDDGMGKMHSIAPAAREADCELIFRAA
jgi:hypothetical protein